MKAPFKHSFPSSSIWLSSFIPHTPTQSILCGDKHVPCASGTKWRVGIQLHKTHAHMHMNTHRCSVQKQVYWQSLCIDKDAVSYKSIVCQAVSDSSSWIQSTCTKHTPPHTQGIYHFEYTITQFNNTNEDTFQIGKWQHVKIMQGHLSGCVCMCCVCEGR